jgi:hypothetical protein
MYIVSVVNFLVDAATVTLVADAVDQAVAVVEVMPDAIKVLTVDLPKTIVTLPLHPPPRTKLLNITRL